MTPITRLTYLTLLSSGIAGSCYFLLQIGSEEWIPVPGEILSAPPEEALYGAIWLLSVSVTLWVTLSAALAVFAYATRLPAAMRAVEWVTIPPIRRAARRTVALILAAGSLSIAAVAGATETPPVPFVVNGDDAAIMANRPTDVPYETPAKIVAPVPVRTGEVVPSRRTDFFPHAAPIGVAALPPLRTGLPSSDRSGYTVYTVQHGDDMWSISVAHLSRHQDKAPSVTGVAALWRETVEVNRDRIRSGNPDLIFPGEALLIPRLSTDR